MMTSRAIIADFAATRQWNEARTASEICKLFTIHIIFQLSLVLFELWGPEKAHC